MFGILSLFENFTLPDIGWANINAVLILVFLEMLLSGDNALVLAIMVRKLPPHLQRQALLYGVVGAFVLRFVCLLAAQYLIQYWFLQTLGAAYLAYLTLGYFFGGHEEEHDEGDAKPADNSAAAAAALNRKFWRVVISVELTDLAFAIDSIIVAVGVSPKLWVVVTGGVIGLLAMRFVADLCVRLLKAYPALEGTAYLLVGWVSVKLFLMSFQGLCVSVLIDPNQYPWIPAAAFADPREHHLMPEWLFWSVTGSILVLGGLVAVLRKPKPAEPGPAPVDKA